MTGFQLQRLGMVEDLQRESIWISYCARAMAGCEPYHLCHFASHHRLATPVAPGMADNRIGVARLDVPEFLPPWAPADLPEQNYHLAGPVKAKNA